MAPHERHRERPIRTTLIGTMMIIVGIFACSGATIIGVDWACNEYIERWAPIYPNAEEISVEYDFLRPRGMGNTLQILETTDDRVTVSRWYGQMYREAGSSEGIGTAGYRLEEMDEGGTRIYLFSRCAWT